ncbi:AAC(3) family N-acetyltransferase [Paenibacillus sp. PK3_47]|uniref:aminoglycoside N(3)-acetyltransferase n=1 Tax=Paenibacillus sp. PK3_47 TaxID=2072642 RepID=UPI00201E5753|nr:AAC(3) family N-acetyltransferase [Paenibacillus sp. PK3_47]UQZ34543.1 AAC(3) family N-acetyltransferase [Paenibacillus sp. PK3_47]
MEVLKGNLITIETLAADFLRLGVKEGMTVLLHSSFKSLGQFVVGGPAAVILALEQVLGEEGTLVMPTQSADLSDPAGWSNPPVPEEWWQTIREQTPAYDPDMTLLRGMGIIPDTFRKQKGVKRSGHPIDSFAAWGRHRDEIIDGHSLDYPFGEASPLARIYELNGSVLLLGVDHLSNTSLHLSEHRADYAGKQEITSGAPMMVDGVRQWVEFKDYNWNCDDFAQLAADFQQNTGQITYGTIAAAAAQLIPQREIVDYGTEWLKRNRK